LGIAAAAAGIAAGYIAGEDEEEPEEQAEGAPTAEAAVAAEISDQPEDETSGEPEEVIPTEDDFGPEAEVIAEQVADGEPEEAAESEIPDWMQEAGWTESAGEVEEAPVSFSEKELDALDAGQLPEGDLEAISQAEEDVELSPAELPDWIHDIAPEDVEGSSDGAGDESIPGWIGAEASFEGEEPFEDVGPLEELLEEAAPPEGLGEDVDTDGDGEVAFPAAEPDPSELPTWITEEPPGATSTIVTWLEDQGPDSTEDEAAEVDDLPDWMRDTGPLEETLDPGIIEIEAEAPPPDEPEIAEPAGELDEVPSPEAPAGGLEEVPSPEAPAGEGWLSAVAAVAAGEDSEPSGSEAELSETPDWLSEAMDSSDEPPAGGIVHGLGIAAAAAVGSDEEDEEEIASLGDDAVGGVGAEAASFEEEEIVEDEVPAEAEISEGEFPSIAEEVKLSESDADAIEQGAPDWLEEIGTLPSQPMDTDSAEWLDGLEIDGEESTAEPASETPDWLKGLAEEGADADTSGAAPAPDWLREIGEPGSISEEAEVVPESIDEEQAAPEAVGGAPDWLQGIDTPVELEQAPEGQEPEPDLAAPPIPAEEDDEVMDWLEDLAAKQAEAEDDQEVAAAAQVAAAAPVIEDREIPEEPEEGLEWLEQLADQRGMDLDVSVPSQAAPMPSEPEPEPTREPELDTTPGWIDRMATQPIPQVDLEALEAATRGEEVSPDAETIEAQASDVEAEIEEAAAEPEAMEPIPEVAPGDITIEARASDLQAAMEAAEQEAEASIPEEDEIPDWLIAAAEQTEAAAPEEPPAKIDFEPEPEIAPKLVDEPVASDEVSEVYVHETAEAAGAVDSEQPAVEEYEFVEEPVVEETDEVEVAPEQLEPEEKVAEVESEAPRAEAKKKEDLLEQSRQALASGDPQAAIEIYGDLIKRKESLDSVIEDLRIAVDRTPENADLWQTLGDAYMRDDQTDEAIDAYRKGMEAA
jgi:tetratricopeptide (TPR) repeat protein